MNEGYGMLKYLSEMVNIVLCFQVNALWLLDLEIYNEWMNEEDYFIDDDTSVSIFLLDLYQAIWFFYKLTYYINKNM